MSKFKRNSHFVRSRVQSAVLCRFLLHWAMFAVSFFLLIFCLHFFLGDPEAPVSAILRQLWQKYSLLAVVTAALVPYFIYDFAKLTHRFAGPMVRFAGALHRAANGEQVGPIEFRKGDYWPELAKDLNAVLARLERDGAAATDESKAPIAVSAPRKPESTCKPQADAELELVAR